MVKNRQTRGLVCLDYRALRDLAKNRSVAAEAMSGEQRLPLYVAETLAKMYRIVFGIFSPPIPNWAEDEALLV